MRLLQLGLSLVVGTVVVLAIGLGAKGCVDGQGIVQRHLDGLRGSKPAVPPDAPPDAREALEQLSQASRVEVSLPSSYTSDWRGTRYCTTGTMVVEKRTLPFGVIVQIDKEGERVLDLSLVRRTCRGRRSRMELQ